MGPASPGRSTGAAVVGSYLETILELADATGYVFATVAARTGPIGARPRRAKRGSWKTSDSDPPAARDVVPSTAARIPPASTARAPPLCPTVRPGRDGRTIAARGRRVRATAWRSAGMSTSDMANGCDARRPYRAVKS